MLEKVRALLNKADPDRGATIPEQEAALAKAQELMTKYGIDVMEASFNNECCFDIGRSDWSCDRGRRNADTYVAHILKKCFGVDIVFTSYHRAKCSAASVGYAIMGDASDREIARLAAPIIYKNLLKGFADWMKTSFQKWSAANERAYCSGMATGYITASEEGKAFAMNQLSKEQKEQFGLILVQKDALIQTFKAAQFPTLKHLRTKRGYADAGANAAGFNRGATLKVIKSHAISA